MTGAVFIDLSKAFDSIDHSILLKKLSSMNIVGREHEWFTDYLCGRMQTLDYRGTYSNQETVTVGVPQGSILGPLLFVIYVNDFLSVIRQSSSYVRRRHSSFLFREDCLNNWE